MYLSFKSKMLMGIDIEGISIVVFVRVLNMLHYIVQGRSSKLQLYLLTRLSYYNVTTRLVDLVGLSWLKKK